MTTNIKTESQAFEEWLLNGNRFRTEPKDIFNAGYKASRESLKKELLSDEMVEKVALKIHQCHYHPMDWNTKEQIAMFKHEKLLAMSKALAALQAVMEEL